MSFAFGGAQAIGQQDGTGAGNAHDGVESAASIAGGQRKANLTAADQLEIDLGKQFRVDLRAVLGADGEVDIEAPAKLVERVARAGESFLRKLDLVDPSTGCQRGPSR